MLKIFQKKQIYFILLLLSSLILINSQYSENSIYNTYCFYDIIYFNPPSDNVLTEDLLNELVITNINGIFLNSTLLYLTEEYQIFLFSNTFCTKKFLEETETSIYEFNNYLHLFSINGTFENDINYIKLVIQTKKQFNILYYDLNGQRINNGPNIENSTFTIKTNIFPYFKTNMLKEDYVIFENESINIFNEKEKIFKDICYIYRTYNETKSPELRKHLYYFKYNNNTYPLEESQDNCLITNNSISYENESFILEYTCKHNLTIPAKKIDIFNISILTEEQKEKYNGPHSLKDQEKLLYCNKETYNKKAIKKNVGFYISLFLLFAVFISWICLIVIKYELSFKDQVESPPKRSLQKDLISSSKKKKSEFFKCGNFSEREKTKKEKN